MAMSVLYRWQAHANRLDKIEAELSRAKVATRHHNASAISLGFTPFLVSAIAVPDTAISAAFGCYVTDRPL